MRFRATSEGIAPVSAHLPATDAERRGWLKRLGAALGLGLLAGPALAGPRGTQRTNGAEDYLGEIMLFAGTFTVQGYMPCDGSLLNISQNAALFSLLGTTYGGNGTTNFALPDLRGRFPIGMGSGPGLTNHPLGDKNGQENVTLTSSQLPAHTHTLNVASGAGTSNTPVSNVLASTSSLLTSSEAGVTTNAYASAANATAAGNAIGTAGSSQPVGVLNPFLALSWQICVQGIFPSRP